jgi:hypothetical protein
LADILLLSSTVGFNFFLPNFDPVYFPEFMFLSIPCKSFVKYRPGFFPSPAPLDHKENVEKTRIDVIGSRLRGK